jgi:hypothetical protein
VDRPERRAGLGPADRGLELGEVVRVGLPDGDLDRALGVSRMGDCKPAPSTPATWFVINNPSARPWRSGTQVRGERPARS